MKTYRLAMTALGLARGDTFSSDEPGWERYVKAGVLTVVEEKTEDDNEADALLLEFQRVADDDNG